jgi:hypothetical protein
MPRRSATRLAFVVLTPTVLLATCIAPAPADVVYLKDGYALHGKVRREADLTTDPLTGVLIPVYKGNNFIVDDRVRWVMFGPRNVLDPDPEVNIRRDFIELTNPLAPGRPNRMPASAKVAKISPFDDHWQRRVTLVNEMGPYTITQRLTLLTPYAARVESNTYQWNVHYLTQELGLETVKKLLATHPDLKETGGPDIEKRMKRFRFLLQAGWLLAAEEELDQALKDLPAEKERIERSRAALRQAQVRSFWDEVQAAHKAGRTRYVSDILRRLPLSELDQRLASEAAALKSKYDTWGQQTQEARRLIDACARRLVGPPRPVLAEAVEAIYSRVAPENLDRLDAFLTLGAQHEQELKSGRVPANTDDDILSLAVTGWVLGGVAAEPRVAAAERLWGCRDFALRYLRTKDPGERRRALEAYQKGQPLGLDEMTQLIALLAPPEAAESAQATGPNGIEERVTQVPWSQNPPVNYVLQLPPEYRPTRAYPLLIVLGNSGERPADALARYSAQAARNGYVLAAPQWAGLSGYNYTAQEHAAVVELVHDLRRRYAIDSDRVFLTGFGDGGTMAFDVGMSHPDLFAGVVPMNGRPRKSASTWYWRNAQYLPFYIVAGQYAGDALSLDRFIFENWTGRGYPSLMTIYQGRPMEFYQAELPFAFDWMNRKKRATGFPELGRNPNRGNSSEEFQTMRSTDNRFYWVTAEEINDRYLNPAVGTKIGSPAAVTAQIREGNHIFINSRGIKHLRVWLGNVWDAQSGTRPMIDFGKPLRITVNNRPFAGGRDRMVTPSLTTMLEDLYQRGDRQRLFLAYVDLTNLQ